MARSCSSHCSASSADLGAGARASNSSARRRAVRKWTGMLPRSISRLGVSMALLSIQRTIMRSPSRNVQYHPPRLSEDRLNLPQPHSPSLPTHCSGKSGMRPSLLAGIPFCSETSPCRVPIEFSGQRLRSSAAAAPETPIVFCRDPDCPSPHRGPHPRPCSSWAGLPPEPDNPGASHDPYRRPPATMVCPRIRLAKKLPPRYHAPCTAVCPPPGSPLLRGLANNERLQP